MSTKRIAGWCRTLGAVCALVIFGNMGRAAADGWSLVLPDYPANKAELNLTAYAGHVGSDYSKVYSSLTAQVETGGPIPASPPSYAAWCVDAAAVINVPIDGVTYDPFSAVLFSSGDPNLNAKLGEGNPGVYHSPSCYQPTEVWKQVNYILNHRGTAFFWDVQEAINRLVGGPLDTHYFTPNETVIQGLLDAAALNAPNWQPQCGDKIAAVAYLDFEDSWWTNPNDDPQLIILEVPVACIGDFVWEDKNGNGLQDGEPGVPNVKVELYDCTGHLFGTTTTDANGKYHFYVPGGSYYVKFYAPDGTVLTKFFQGTDPALDSNANPATGITLCITVLPGESNMTIDGGLYEPACIGDFAWEDLNGNGIQDAGEPGIPGVTVALTDCSGTVLGTTTTDAQGKYAFCDLAPGQYAVVFTTPGDYVVTKTGEGGDACKDSDIGKVICVTLASGQTDNCWDGGFYRPACIGDFVWEDLNGNGIQDIGEPGIPGVTVALTDCSGKVLGTTTTDALGKYAFCDLAPGQYAVVFTTPGGYVVTKTGEGGDACKDSDIGKTICVTLASGQTDSCWDGGFYKPASIGDYVWDDLNKDGMEDSGEKGIPGVTVKLTDCSGNPVIDASGNPVVPMVTGANGDYKFVNLVPGTYQVVFMSPAGYVLSTAFQGGNTALDSNAGVGGVSDCRTLVSGQYDSTVDAGYHQMTPGLELTKSADKSWVLPGGQVTYTYVVKNTGEIPINNVTVVDDSGTPDFVADDIVVGTIASLAPGASQMLTFTSILPQKMCMTIYGTNVVVGYLYTSILVSGDIQVTYVQQAVNDNRYGTGATAATGWNRSQSFNNLVGSDKAEFRFTDGKGNVVLDFFCDYITSSSAFPSGYGCLGATGGDGSVVVGSSANILSATTSLSDNFNTPGSPFKTGYFVNSPPETAPLSGVSIPAGWDYDNSYTVVVKAATFGANGFGGVTIPAVHDSPPKLGSSNLITPTNCSDCVVNIAVASGTPQGSSTAISAEATATVCFGTPPPPKLTLQKDADKTVISPSGDSVTYTYTVKNTGGETINDITVVDDNGTPSDTSDDHIVGTIESLDPLGSETFSQTFDLTMPEQPETMCMTINGVNTIVGYLYTTVLASGDVQVTYVQQAVNDNRYGTGATAATGWNRSQSFNNLVGSDKAEFRFTDGTGKVVLDFFCDYITASTKFPSGYGCLGATGGDGSMVVGSLSSILSATTSLSDNFNTKADFKTGYFVNSPPETAPLSGISVPAGWDYNNSYTVIVSKAAFGANGFGGVTIPAVHDSPPKIGSSNLITPIECNPCIENVATASGTAESGTVVSTSAKAQVCFGTPSGGGSACSIVRGTLKLSSNQMQLPLKNTGTTDIFLKELTESWPLANGKLTKVSLNGQIWGGKAGSGDPLTVTLTTAEFDAYNTDQNRRRIKPGETKTLVLQFEKNVNQTPSNYSGSIKFGDDASCILNLP